jgi:hypothetical protein
MITLDEIKNRLEHFGATASDSEIQYLLDKENYWFCNQTGLPEIPDNAKYVMIDKIVAEIIKDSTTGTIGSIKEGDTSVTYLSSGILDAMLNPDLRYWTSGKMWNMRFCDRNWYDYITKIPFQN